MHSRADAAAGANIPAPRRRRRAARWPRRSTPSCARACRSAYRSRRRSARPTCRPRRLRSRVQRPGGPAQIVAQCQPARFSGILQRHLPGTVQGTCNGQCQGQCSAMGANGQCAGTVQRHLLRRLQRHLPRELSRHLAGAEVRRLRAAAERQTASATRAATPRPSSGASCTPAQINVMTNANTQEAMRLVATLRANLPELLHAELALGKRLVGSAKVVVRHRGTAAQGRR